MCVSGDTEQKVGASPGASNTFTSRQQWVPFLALDTKSIHVGWEKASFDLLMQELPCPSRSALSEDQCNQETRRVSASWDTEHGG